MMNGATLLALPSNSPVQFMFVRLDELISFRAVSDPHSHSSSRDFLFAAMRIVPVQRHLVLRGHPHSPLFLQSADLHSPMHHLQKHSISSTLQVTVMNLDVV
jgi:hypothetical protein